MRPIALRILILCGAPLAGAGCANAPERSAPMEEAAPAAAPASHAELEAIFWTCDYLATTRGIDATPIGPCTAATRELRQVKFGGSFNRLLEWWRENKMAEHGRIRRQRNDPVL